MRHSVWSLLVATPFLAQIGLASQLPEGCDYEKECVVELVGSRCGDGSPSYFSFFPKRDSQDLVVFLESGGACWSKDTCKAGHVTRLSRKPSRKFALKEKGLLDLENPLFPLHGSHLVTIPYCTGDVFLGDTETNYGSENKPNLIHHRGYRNVILTLEAVSSLFPNLKRVVLLGRSAGGLGVHGHVRSLDHYFPQSQKFAIADAGTPFMPPYLREDAYLKIMKAWNAFGTLPPLSKPGGINHFGEVLKFNQMQFPHIRFGLIQAYEDSVMTYFAKSVGAPVPSEAVRRSMIEASNTYLGLETPHAKVFFLNGKSHVQTKKDLAKLVSEETSLLEWLNGMFHNGEWENVRPDLHSQ